MRKLNVVTFACVSVLAGAVASATFAWDDIATFFGATTDPYNVCFGIQSVNDTVLSPTMPQFAQFRRTRREDGSQDMVQFPRSQWTLSTPAAQGNMYCAPPQTSPRQGHFVYELRVCPTDPTVDASACSPWISSIDPTVAQMNGQPRAWWIYGFIDPTPPAAVTVTSQ